MSDSEAASGSMYVSMVEVMVRDWGYGIEPQHLELIFERFNRLERDLNSPVRGSGLGLAICRELVSLMGGSLPRRECRADGRELPHCPTSTISNCHARPGRFRQVGGSSMRPSMGQRRQNTHRGSSAVKTQEVERAIEALKAWSQALQKNPSSH